MKDKIRAFLQVIYEGSEGIICLSTKRVDTGQWQDHYFGFPDELEDAVDFAATRGIENDLYFCPNILGSKSCHKNDVISSSCIWADVDEADPKEFTVQPSIIIETSPGRTQAYWLIGEPCDPDDTEAIARAVAYENTSDKNGWNRNRKLRVPLTYNHKYQPPKHVKLIDFSGDRYSLEKLKTAYYIGEDGPNPTTTGEGGSTETDIETEDADDVLERYKLGINPRAFDLFNNEPATKDWSSSLWNLELLLIEAGLDDVEVFSVVRESACNKYKRDGRPEYDLWAEVQKARERSDEANNTAPVQISTSSIVTPLLTEKQRDEAAHTEDLVQEYIEWAKKQSDAAWQYHQAGIFIVLSTLLTGSVTLPMSFGTMRPNMWFMILGDTTLTRKSTAMDMATDLLEEVDPDALLATDASIEGLLTQLSTRPGRPSLFLRDEITGLIESIQKKDYYAGMFETLTKLYDGKRQKRILRKEEIDIREPNFLFFAGGIKSRMMELLSFDHINSGFLPRFCFVSAESDTTKLKPVGPPTEKDKTFYNRMIVRLIHMHKFFNHAKTEDGKRKIWEASLTDDAWYLYNQFEYRMVSDVMESTQKDVLTPIMSRLANSGLKAAVILASIDPNNKDEIVVDEAHLLRAFYFIEQWREYALEVVAGAGSSNDERKISQIMQLIEASPGISRPELMRLTKMKPQEMDYVITTLQQREMISSSKDETKRLHYRPSGR